MKFDEDWYEMDPRRELAGLQYTRSDVDYNAVYIRKLVYFPMIFHVNIQLTDWNCLPVIMPNLSTLALFGSS
jgi:hypothetical protein